MKKTSKRILGIAAVALLVAVALVGAGAADGPSINPSSIHIGIGDTYQLTATGFTGTPS